MAVWDWLERKLVCKPRPVGYSRPTFHPNDRELVFGDGNKTFRFDISSDTIVSESSSDQLRYANTAFSADGKLLAIFSNEFNTTVVDGQTFEPLARLAEIPRVDTAVWHPTEPTLVVGDIHGRRYIWNHTQRWPITAPESSASTWRLGPPQPLVQHKSMTALLNDFDLAPQHFGRTSAMIRRSCTATRSRRRATGHRATVP